jgi:hypothetical protein
MKNERAAAIPLSKPGAPNRPSRGRYRTPGKRRSIPMPGSVLRVTAALWLLTVVSSLGCGSAPHPDPKPPQVGWRPIISFSGSGSEQTESFNIESTEWRIKWETKGAAPSGMFQVVVHSAVSGRPLVEAVRRTGAGHGIAYVTEDPRLYHLVIDSKDLDWSIAIEEAVVGQGETVH